MAESKQDEKDKAPAVAAREAQRAADPPADAETFDRAWLMEASSSVGYEPHIIAGALSGVHKKHLTIEETQDACKAFLAAPVKEA